MQQSLILEDINTSFNRLPHYLMNKDDSRKVIDIQWAYAQNLIDKDLVHNY